MKKLIIAIAFLAAVGMAGAAPRLSEPWLYRQVLIGFNACGVIAGDDHFDMNRLNRFCNEMADLPFAEHVMVFMASEHDMLIRVTKGVIAWVDRETDAAEALLLRVVKTWHDVLRSDPKLVEHWKAIMKVDPTMGPMPVHLTVEYAGHLIAESFDAPDGEYYFVIYGILRNSTSGTPESP